MAPSTVDDAELRCRRQEHLVHEPHVQRAVASIAPRAPPAVTDDLPDLQELVVWTTQDFSRPAPLLAKARTVVGRAARAAVSRLPAGVRRCLVDCYHGWQDRETLHTYEIDVAAELRPAPRPPRGIELATAGSLAALLDERGGHFARRKHDLMIARIDEPDEYPLLIVDDDGTVAGYCHLATADNLNERIGHRVRVGDDAVYLYDSRVFDDRRRRGLHAMSIAERLRIAHDLGRDRALTTISDPNVASRRSYAAFGARPVHLLVHVPRLGRTFALPARGRGGPASSTGA